MKNVTLNNGIEMPIFRIRRLPDPDAAECEKSVLTALETGYRSLDTAAAYGNEEAVGNAIRRSGIGRKELFITTKLWISNAGYEKSKTGF